MSYENFLNYHTILSGDEITAQNMRIITGELFQIDWGLRGQNISRCHRSPDEFVFLFRVELTHFHTIIGGGGRVQPTTGGERTLSKGYKVTTLSII